jgi:hypothetical protein
MAQVIQGHDDEWVLRDEWTIDDVRSRIDYDELGIRVDDDDCINILKIMADQHDANIGINWDVMDAAIEIYSNAIANETPIYVKGVPLTNNGKPVWE